MPPEDRNPRAGARGKSGWIGYGLAVAGVLLGWEILKVPVVERAAPAVAIRLAPGSPEVLRRAAEAEFAAGRTENASALAESSLRRAPFNVRALRVRGLAESEAGNTNTADEIMTLAGNWSLRDDPSHAWLVERRMRQGALGSAFAHADTLARRREDMYPQLFDLFTTAARADPRGLSQVASLLAAAPPWRPIYLGYLNGNPANSDVIFGVTVLLQRSARPLTNVELERVYEAWVSNNQYEAVRLLREQINRPPLEPIVQRGGFDPAADAVVPFDWNLMPASGLSMEVLEDELDASNLALWVSYRGSSIKPFIRQLLVLRPGQYRLAGSLRPVKQTARPSMKWSILCVGSGAELVDQASLGDAAGNAARWEKFSHGFTVPQQGCNAQWLQLSPSIHADGGEASMWFDNVEITPGAGTAG